MDNPARLILPLQREPQKPAWNGEPRRDPFLGPSPRCGCGWRRPFRLGCRGVRGGGWEGGGGVEAAQSGACTAAAWTTSSPPEGAGALDTGSYPRFLPTTGCRPRYLPGTRLVASSLTLPSQGNRRLIRRARSPGLHAPAMKVETP